MSERIFCACAPGLEPVLAAELASLGLSVRAVPGGAGAEGFLHKPVSRELFLAALDRLAPPASAQAPPAPAKR